MELFPDERKRYSKEQLTAREAQRQAQYIAWAPVIFQVSRLMLKYGILGMLRDSLDGMTLAEVKQASGLSEYAVKILLEASLSAGTVLIDPDTDRYTLSKTGYFLLADESTRANMDFNHDVNYRGLFHLDEAMEQGKPAGLKTLGDWPTIYEGLSKLPADVQKSWFGFDHFYSDSSFEEALAIVLKRKPKRVMDVGGNTGRFALNCVGRDADVRVTIVDLPGQIGLMRKNTEGKPGADRISGHPTDMLKAENRLPEGPWDAIWMSQFLDCFSEEEICAILRKAAEVMTDGTILYIMETFWNRQKFETSSLCLTMTSVYFTAMANGNSKMYHSDDMIRQVERAGLRVKEIHDGLGLGHTIMEVVK